MDTHPRYALVGSVLLALIVGLAFWFSWLWKGKSADSQSNYAVYFKQQSLSGLQVDSVVTMRGIRIGSVKAVEIQPQDIERVRVTISVNRDTPVRTDTKAVITRNLLTGLAAVDLVGSTQKSPRLAQVHEGEKYPVITEGTTGLDQVQQSVPELMGKASETLQRINVLLSDDNIAHVNSIIANVEKGSVGLEKVGNLIVAADEAFQSLGGVTGEAKGKIAPALKDFGSAMAEARQLFTTLSSDLKTLIRSVTATSNNLREPRSAVLGLPSGKLGPGEGKN